PRLAFACYAQARAGIHARRDANLNCLRLWHHALAVTFSTRLAALARALAIRASLIEAHAPAHRRNLARAFAGRTSNLPAGGFACPTATRARIRATHADISRQTVDRFFKAERERYFNIRAALSLWVRLRRGAPAAAAEQL